MSIWSTVLSWVLPQPKTITIGGLTGTIDAATLEAAAQAIFGVDPALIEQLWVQGKFVVAGEVALDDALKIADKIFPQLKAPELALQILIVLGEASTPHNSGEGGIGNDPAGPGNVVTGARK